MGQKGAQLSLRFPGLLHGGEHGGAELRWGLGHVHPSRLQGLELGRRGALAPGHDRARVTHAPTRRRRHACWMLVGGGCWFRERRTRRR